jgi:hypothetical protein
MALRGARSTRSRNLIEWEGIHLNMGAGGRWVSTVAAAVCWSNRSGHLSKSIVDDRIGYKGEGTDSPFEGK